MAFWSAGPKCGNYFHAAESGRRWDEMEGRYQCAVLAPYKAGHLDCRMVCFLRHRGLSPVSPSHLRNFVETAPTLRSYGQFAQGSGAFDLPIRKLSYTSGAKQRGVVISGRFRSAFLVFFVIFRRFENVLQVMGYIDLDQDRRVNETRSPEIVWK